MADVTISRAEFAGTAMVSCWPDTQAKFTEQLHNSLGLQVPDRSNCFVEGDERLIACVSPGRFLVCFEKVPLGTVLSENFDEELCTIVDLGNSRQLFRITGSKAAQLLMKGVAIDLDQAAFPVGSLFQSAIHDIGVIALRRGPDWFDLLVYKSFAESFAHWLEDAAMEFS